MTKRHLHEGAQRRHQPNLRLERWHRWALYLSIGSVILTGLLFLLAHYFLRTPGEFGEAPHWLEPSSMRLHGGTAMLVLFFAGSLMNSHVRRAFKSGRNLYSGCAMIATMVVLVATGYGLYYIAGESDRGAWSATHWIVGIALAAVFVAHIALGRRSRVQPGLSDGSHAEMQPRHE